MPGSFPDTISRTAHKWCARKHPERLTPLRFTKTLIGTSVAAAALGLLATAAPAMAADTVSSSSSFPSFVAPGATGPMNFVATDSTSGAYAFSQTAADGLPQTIVFTAPANTTFPDQTTVPAAKYMAGATTPSSTGTRVTNCTVADAGKTLNCTFTDAGGTTGWQAGSSLVFSPQVTVSSSVAAGTVLTGGATALNFYNVSNANLATFNTRVTGVTSNVLLTGTPGPGAPIYNTDSTVDIPGYGNPGSTITIKDANGNTIGTATVAADGTYDVKISAADAATAAAAGPVQVTESDMPGTTWPVTIDVTILGTPIINPLVGGGIALAAAAGFGTVLLVRRRKIIGTT
jgi:hypothetical protein